MPDVRMPDGTIIRNVPEGTTKEELMSKLNQFRGVEQPQQVEPMQVATTQQPQASGAGFESVGQRLQASLEPAATFVTGAVAEPVAGLAGLAQTVNPFADPGAGARAVEAVREALTFVPRTPQGMAAVQKVAEVLSPIGEGFQAAEQATGMAGFEAAAPAEGAFMSPERSALGGAVGAALPTAATELIGLGITRRVTRSADVEAVKETKPQVEAVENVKTGVEPEIRDYNEISDLVRNKKATESAIKAVPDKDILDAAKALNVDLNPSHYATNRAFIEVEQSLKSRPGSKLGAKEAKAIKDLGDRADKLIADLGGTTDKSVLDAAVRNDIQSTTSRLEGISSSFYRIVEDVIPKPTKVEPKASKAYFDKVLEDLGGDEKLLSSAEKKLLALTREEANPTYGALDRVRKDVGSALGKKQGPFKDDDTGSLKRIYRVLSEDQQGVADAFGVGQDYAAARKLVESRKQVEDSAKVLLGRELQGSIVPKMRAAGASLTKGDISKFNALINAVPPARRQEAAAMILGDIFTSGARSATQLSQGFVNAFDNLNRNKNAKKALFKHLPDGAETRFDNIGKVATGIFRSKALENTSKTARDIIAAMDDGGMFTRVMGVGSKIAAAESITTAVSMPGAGTAGVLGAALARKRTPATEAADEFLVSDEFKTAIETAATQGPEAAQEVLDKSQKYKNWLKFQPKRDSAQIGAVGFIPWVTGQTEEENEQIR